MKIHTLASVAAAAFMAAAGASATPNTGRPYLKRPAFTAAALAGQVSSDPQLVARYSKHFKAGPAAVTAAFRSARPITLPAATYTVWLTGPNGLRYPTVQERTAETPAFEVSIARGGSPAWLEAGSGNPIERFQPVEEIEVVEAEPPPPRVVDVEVPREVLVAAGPTTPGE
jgi:hypothetical protein